MVDLDLRCVCAMLCLVWAGIVAVIGVVFYDKKIIMWNIVLDVGEFFF